MGNGGQRGGQPVLPVLLLAVGVAVALGVGLTQLVSVDELANLGLPTPDATTQVALPAVRVLSEVAAVCTVGALLLAAFLVPPQRSGILDVGGYRAVRSAGVTALAWALAAAAMVPLTTADLLARPLRDTLSLQLLVGAVGDLTTTGSWALTAAIALLLAAGCWAVLTWGRTVLLFGVSVVGLLPVAITGHASAGGSHDLASNSLILHLVASALWVGGLVALLVHLARGYAHAGLAVSRFSALALACWLTLAVSGVINALVRATPADLLGSSYGLLLLGKIVGLGALGVLGLVQRRRAVAAVVQRGDRSALLRFGSVEVLVMLATIGLAAALGRTPPPADPTDLPSAVEVTIGYDLDGPLTLAGILLDWRFDLIFGTVSLLAAAVYLAGVRRLRRRGDSWPLGRTLAWLAGCAMVLVATSSGLGRYAPAMLSAHMGQHMVLSMLAPALLVLGGGVTLALRALPAAGADAAPGPREWLLAAVHSTPSRVLTHPVVALVLFVGSFYALYFSGLFDQALLRHWAHLAMNLHFILVGYLFYWPIIGIDPAPRRLPYLGRLGLLFASMPFHAFFGVILMNTTTLVGESFYRALALPFVSDLAADQRLAGGLAWSSGEVPLLVVLVALLVQWSRSDDREARRADRRADADGDADLAAYNAMLAELAERDRAPGR